MISGFISNKCIAQERLDHAQKQFDTMSSKLRTLDDPLNYVIVRLQTPNFPQLEIDRNIFCDNYSQVLREIPTFRQIPELTTEGNKRFQNLLNEYKQSLGLTKFLDQNTSSEDLVSDENNERKPIQETFFNPSQLPVPSNPYANLNLGNQGKGLVGQYIANEYYKNTAENQNREFEQANKGNLIRAFKQKTGVDDSVATYYLESCNFDLPNALEIFNSNK